MKSEGTWLIQALLLFPILSGSIVGVVQFIRLPAIDIGFYVFLSIVWTASTIGSIYLFQDLNGKYKK